MHWFPAQSDDDDVAADASARGQEYAHNNELCCGVAQGVTTFR